MKVLLCGSSGMVGRGVLLECLDDPRIESVCMINRKSIDLQHSKLTEIIHSDLSNVSNLKDQLSGLDACYFSVGVTSIGMSESDYRAITYNMTIQFAEQFLRWNPNSIFCYVTGQGTDSSMKSRSFWPRIKGETENKLLSMDFEKAYMFRPGYIQPLRGIQSKTNWYSILYKIFWPVYLVLKHFPSTATNTTNMGLAMIQVSVEKPDIKILENKDINEWANTKN